MCKDALDDCLAICEAFGLADDPENLEANEDYSTDIVTKYASAMGKANDYIDSISKPDPTHPISQPTQQPAAPAPNPLESKLEKMCDLLSLPETPLDIFDGNILEFHSWWTVYQERVGMKNVNPMVKLNKLLHAIQGEPYDLIHFCKGLGGEVGYTTACDILFTTYDDPDAVSQAYVDNLKGGGKVTTPSEFLRLAADLRSASAILKKHDRLSELENQNSMKSIVMRLPNFAILKWRKIALNSKFDSAGQNKYPSFQKFIDFVILLAKEARDSTWGNLSELLSDGTEVNHNVTDSKAGYTSCNNAMSSTFSNLAPLNVPKCLLCNDSHHLPQCVKFRTMSVEQRVSFALSNHVCFRCLLTGHFARDCSSTYVCSVPNCGKPHMKWFHPINPERRGNTSIQPAGAQPQTNNSSVEHNSGNDTTNSAYCINAPCRTPGSNCVLLPLVPIQINGHSRVEYAVLDKGSQRSVIESSLADELGLNRLPTNSVLEGIWESNKVNTKVECEIMSSQNGNKCNLDALVVPRITARHPPKQVNIAQFPYLADLPVTSGELPKARILIGLDNAHLLLPLDTRHCGDESVNTLFAEKTFLGWALNGPLCDNLYCDTPDVSSCGNINLSFDDFRSWEKLWEIEHGSESTNHSLAPDDQRALKLWDEESQFIDGRWHVPIPWKFGKPNFENNVAVAKHLLDALVKRLQRDGLMDLYHKAVQKLIDKGYVEKVPDHELHLNDGSVRYLPHFHDKKRTKDDNLRIIMDAKHKVRGVSLNNQCLQGPNYVNNLNHIVLRLRQYQYIVKADIEGMYMQIRLFPEDRRSMRFLWYSQNGDLIHFQYKAHIFGGVSSGSAAGYILDRICRDDDISESLKTTIRREFYVDDLCSSKKKVSEIKEIIIDGRKKLKENGLNLTAFVVNDETIANEIEEDCKAVEMIDFSSAEVVNSKTLGIRLDVKADQFIYINYPQRDDKEVTRRIMLTKVPRLFDPANLIVPIAMKGRIIFQDVTRLRLGWDDPVPPEITKVWNQWLDSLTGLELVRFDRCLLPEGYADGVSELIHFSDASRRAYGACTYLRTITHEGKIKVDLLMSRGRVSPLKEHSIARLELCGALESVRLDRYLKETMDIPFVRSTYFVDSKIALAYIANNSKRFSVFVANRVREIRESSEPSQWNYIESKLNPADLITHGCGGDELTDLWKYGPDFLRTYRNAWPVTNEQPVLTDESEVISDYASINLCNAIAIEQKSSTDILLDHYSSYYKLKQATAWLRRFFTFIADKNSCKIGPITTQELRDADRSLILYVQKVSFSKEITYLEQKKPLPRTSSLVSKDPVLHNGLLVIGGRLKHSNLPSNCKHRVILPKNHNLSKVIVAEHHAVGHTGIEWTLSMINQNFYIVGARNMLKVLRSKCITCRKLHARYVEQKMSDLPPQRTLAFLQPFSFMGLDVFGPFRIRQGRAEVKRYGLVFTCFSTRGIHLEMIYNLETDSFLNGLIRFISRRSKPKRIFCDNGTNLRGGYNELARAWNEVDRKKVGNAAKSMDIEWEFNVPLASHQGGVYERMIRTVRRVIESMINPHTRLTDDVLQTFFCQVEYIVNSRPITKVSDDPLDEAALCPNNLLVIGSCVNFPVGHFRDADKYRRQWRYVQFLVDHFWRRWVKEYLPMLVERPKWRRLRNDVKVGDLMLLEDATVARYSWPLARVTKVNLSRTDGLVRSVELRSQGKTFVRPITKVVSLEGAIVDDST